MNNKLIAVVDLGSLKAKLMVFDTKTLDIVFQKSYLTLLGKSISGEGIVVEEALNRLDEALSHIKNELVSLDCVDVKFIATESLRIAQNTEEVYLVVEKYFHGHNVTILEQGLEGEMFFRVVSRCFADQSIVTMDVGGGSVQILHGTFQNKQNQYSVHNKYLYKTGTYKLQQKYSPDNSVISQEFYKAVNEVKKEFNSLNITNDTLIFGSTCMQDFLKESGVTLYDDRPIKKHSSYTTIKDLKELLAKLRQFSPDNRSHFYPSGEYFIYGADYLLTNVIEVAERLEAKYIYPTNMNSSYGFAQ